MPATRVVETLDEVEDGHPGLGLRVESAGGEQLALERREKALAQGVFAAVAHRAHRRADAGLLPIGLARPAADRLR